MQTFEHTASNDENSPRQQEENTRNLKYVVEPGSTTTESDSLSSNLKITREPGSHVRTSPCG